MDFEESKKVVMGERELKMPPVSQRMMGVIILAILGLVLLFTTFYKVGADEVAIVRRFGRYTRTTEPGLHIKWPFGIETVKKPKVKKLF